MDRSKYLPSNPRSHPEFPLQPLEPNFHIIHHTAGRNQSLVVSDPSPAHELKLSSVHQPPHQPPPCDALSFLTAHELPPRGPTFEKLHSGIAVARQELPHVGRGVGRHAIVAIFMKPSDHVLKVAPDEAASRVTKQLEGDTLENVLDVLVVIVVQGFVPAGVAMGVRYKGNNERGGGSVCGDVGVKGVAPEKGKSSEEEDYEIEAYFFGTRRYIYGEWIHDFETSQQTIHAPFSTMVRNQDPYSTPVPQTRHSQPILSQSHTARYRTPAAYGATTYGASTTYVASPTTPVRSTQPIASTPAGTRSDETPFTGRWENPAFRKLLEEKLEKGVKAEMADKIRWSLGGLLGMGIFSQTPFHRAFTTMFGKYFRYLEIFLCVLFIYNICEGMWNLLKPSENFANLPLTPTQRKMVGLDPRVKPTVNNPVIPVPHYSRSSPKSRPDHFENNYGPTRTVNTPSSFKPNPGTAFARIPGFYAPTPASPMPPFSLRKTPVQRVAYDPFGSPADLDRLLREETPSMKTTETTTQSSGLGTSSVLPDRSGMLSDTSVILPTSVPGMTADWTYHTATRSMPTTATVGKGDSAAGGAGAILEPDKVLAKLKIEQHMHNWTHGMREWISNRVVIPLANRIDQVDADLEKEGWGYLNTTHASYFRCGPPPVAASTTAGSSTATGSGLFYGSAPRPSLFGGSTFGNYGQPQPPQPPQSLMDLAQRFGTQAVVKERLKIEKYLNVDGFSANSRDYVLERRWRGGPSSWRSRGTAAPTGGATAGLGARSYRQTRRNTQTRPFPAPDRNAPILHLHGLRHAHVRRGPTPNWKPPVRAQILRADPKKQIQIRQIKKSPPHFLLNVGTTTWDVYPKRNNVFQTLVLFTYYVQKEHNGYLGLLNLAGRAIDLVSVVEDWR
ncbi:hypothetical protein BC938DRAFT_481926 [Jimgerdemannia flammicorona]|uniref:Uncharacterized protein n=1 Tax=Jimgerdemannia flammicorona TaxID=994334 RepID=A0A433QF06_9FUNG|nr:hypothetical protein BC938DRAFT_481926 [Jimgerdemannia flammicorona]